MSELPGGVGLVEPVVELELLLELDELLEELELDDDELEELEELDELLREVGGCGTDGGGVGGV